MAPRPRALWAAMVGALLFLTPPLVLLVLPFNSSRLRYRQVQPLPHLLSTLLLLRTRALASPLLLCAHAAAICGLPAAALAPRLAPVRTPLRAEGLSPPARPPWIMLYARASGAALWPKCGLRWQHIC